MWVTVIEALSGAGGVCACAERQRAAVNLLTFKQQQQVCPASCWDQMSFMQHKTVGHKSSGCKTQHGTRQIAHPTQIPLLHLNEGRPMSE